jgi:hypothetical protein
MKCRERVYPRHSQHPLPTLRVDLSHSVGEVYSCAAPCRLRATVLESTPSAAREET